MKIASWNVNSLRVRLPQVLQWLETEQPDVLALQETKSQDKDFPETEIKDAGYEVIFCGQKTYNGVAIISKTPAKDVIDHLTGETDEQRRLLSARYHGIRIINVYVPNGQNLESDKFIYKLKWLEQLKMLLVTLQKTEEKIIILGDFNIAPANIDVHDIEKWSDTILCSKAERDSLQAILDCGLTDTFREFRPETQEFSWWDYRMAGFRRNLGLRIDLILASPALMKNTIACSIDKTPRGWERPSDHTPVLIEITKT